MDGCADPRYVIIERAARSVKSLAGAMPSRGDVKQGLADAQSAQQRGYFLPDEDVRLRDVFARYLSLRAALLEVTDEVQALLGQLDDEVDEELAWDLRLRAFLVGFVAAAMLMRAAGFIVDLASRRSVIRKKLDEVEPSYGIPAKSYTAIYKSLGSYRRMRRFQSAVRFYELHTEDIIAIARDPRMQGLDELLREESKYFQLSKLDHFRRKFNYRLHSLKRRHVSGYKKVMFQLLKLGGRAVSEMRQPFVKAPGQGKRVTTDVVSELKSMLLAGDVLITRHEDAMSNLFLPGFWPHAALFVGNEQELAQLGLGTDLLGGMSGSEHHCLEAKKDGVLLRSIEETLSVDAFMVLRPELTHAQRVEALTRALSHEGKLYDFMFDFRRSDRLACTEVIYRSYHGVGNKSEPISFELQYHSGRPCISAEDLIEQALASGYFKKLAEFGVERDTISVF